MRFVVVQKNAFEFGGRFVVKIAYNPIKQIYLIPSANNVTDNVLTARAYSYWLADPNSTSSILVVTNKINNTTYNWTANTPSGGITNKESELATALKSETDA